MIIQIAPIRISEHIDTNDEMMRGLYESEQRLFNKTDDGPNIRGQYLRHVIRMKEESEGT